MGVGIAAIEKAITVSGSLADVGTDVWVNGIKWRVLKNDGETLFVVADQAIDCKNYNEVCRNVTWESSTIRNWLNNRFYHTAFSSNDQSAIAAWIVVDENNPKDGTVCGQLWVRLSTWQ